MTYLVWCMGEVKERITFGRKRDYLMYNIQDVKIWHRVVVTDMDMTYAVYSAASGMNLGEYGIGYDGKMHVNGTHYKECILGYDLFGGEECHPK